jgi:hypothetical protein
MMRKLGRASTGRGRGRKREEIRKAAAERALRMVDSKGIKRFLKVQNAGN